MPIPLDAPEVLQREFLEIRARLLQVAASLDRLGRAEGSVADDPGWPRSTKPWRSWPTASRIGPSESNCSFRAYDSQWQATFKLPAK